MVLDQLASVESVKSASDIYAPLSGQVLEINEELSGRPGTINKSPEEDGSFLLFASDLYRLDLQTCIIRPRSGDGEYNRV
jgi:glycine cleavage system H lipoate-binding protein